MTNINNPVVVKGCGCRFRFSSCEYLCAKHKDEFILDMYNDKVMSQ
jgi:hypothetical protein